MSGLYVLIALVAGCSEHAEWDSETATQIQALSNGTSSDAP